MSSGHLYNVLIVCVIQSLKTVLIIANIKDIFSKSTLKRFSSMHRVKMNLYGMFICAIKRLIHSFDTCVFVDDILTPVI